MNSLTLLDAHSILNLFIKILNFNIYIILYILKYNNYNIYYIIYYFIYVDLKINKSQLIFFIKNVDILLPN